MALEKGNISLLDSKNKNSKKSAAPTKNTINFVKPKRKVDPVKTVVAIVLIVAALAAFFKFGFVDQNAKLNEAVSVRDTSQMQLLALSNKLQGYDDLAEEYARYSYGLMSDSEKELVSRLRIMDVLEKYIMPVCSIDDFSVKGNIVSLNLVGATLEQASAMVDKLEGDPVVVSASVYTASADEMKENNKKNVEEEDELSEEEELLKLSRVFMSIVFANEEVK